MTIRLVETDAELAACFPVVVQLRPHLTLEMFQTRVRSQLRQGYRIAYVEVDGAPAAVAGFRFLETLNDGKFLYVDDLVTDEARRSRGFGAALLAWLADRARENSCESVQLDSGLQRKDAHRFYEREGMERTSYHFRRRL